MDGLLNVAQIRVDPRALERRGNTDRMASASFTFRESLLALKVPCVDERMDLVSEECARGSDLPV